MNETRNGLGLGLGLAVVGCDFRVASSSFRSRLVLSATEAKQLAEELMRNQAADGFVDLNTCNRNEWIVSGPDPRWAAELLYSQMLIRLGPEAQARIQPYRYLGEEAARHIFRVAIGQESLVVGERQIAGQLYHALETSRERCISSRNLNGLGSIAGRLVRIALRRGQIENAAVGVHSLALNYLRKALSDAKNPRVAVVGLGRIGRRVQGLLEDSGFAQPILCNRTVRIDRKDNIRPLDQLGAVLAQVDAAVICTGAAQPILPSSALAKIPVDGRLVLVDIGIPEQVERSDLPAAVSVAGLDELTQFHRDHHQLAEANQAEVEKLIERALVEHQAFCHESAFSGILDTVQRHHRQLVDEEIPRRVAAGFGYLPAEAREQLQGDLKSIVLEYTTEVFRTIKETALRDAQEASCRDES